MNRCDGSPLPGVQVSEASFCEQRGCATREVHLDTGYSLTARGYPAEVTCNREGATPLRGQA